MIRLLNSWLNKHSLRFKLNISILTCVCLVFLSLVFIISKKSEPIIKSQIDTIVQKTVDSYVTTFAHIVSDTEQIIINTKNTLNQMRDDNIDALRVVLQSAIKTVYHSDLKFTNAWLYIFPPEDVSKGTLYTATDSDDHINFNLEKIDNFYDKFPWFKEVPKEEKIYWSEPYFDKEIQKTVVTTLIPFKFLSQDDFNGLVSLTIDLSDLQTNINNFSFYETGKLILLSRSGLYVNYPDPGVALKMTIFELSDKLNLPELKIIGRDLAMGKGGKISIPHSPVFDNDTAIFYYAPIKSIGWGFCLVYGQNYLLKPISDFKIITLVSLLISILLLLLIINRICRNSTNQLITISHIANQYGKGDFSKQFNDVPMTSDIKILSNALSSMRTNLLAYIDKERSVASEKQKALSELDIARHIQKSALSIVYPQSDAFEIATTMIPAQIVGGDFYDFFFIDDNKFAILVADVSGKGIPASLYMMKALTLIRNVSKYQKKLDLVFKLVNEQLSEGNDSCMFVTTCMAVIDLLNGKTTFINAGHIPPLLKHEGNISFIKPHTNIALGINPQATFIEDNLTLEPETHLFLYTDGVTEAENTKKQFYGENRLSKIYQKAQGTPQDNLNLVLKDIKKFVKTHPQSDDITMLDFAFYGPASEMTIAADTQKLDKVLSFIKNDMIRYSLSEKAQFNMVMATEEIFSNIAMYAYNSTKDAIVNIETHVNNDLYSVTFKDNGKKYNPLENSAPDITADMKDKSIGGLGVFLARKLTDVQTYSYKNKQNILTIGIYINK